MALSFGSMGATPSNGAMGWLGSFGYKPTQGSTPAASALNNAQIGPNRSVVPPQPATPAPTTPVKSTTITHPDGTSIATTYHPETTPGLINSSTGKTNQQVLDESSAAVKTAQGVLNASGHSVGTQHPGDAGFNPVPPVTLTQGNVEQYDSSGKAIGSYPQPIQSQTTQPETFGGIVNNLVDTSQNGSQNATQATTGLLQAPQQNQQIGDEAKQIANNSRAALEKLAQQATGYEGGQLTTGTSPVASGNAAITANLAAQQGQRISQAEQAALQGNVQELTAQNQGQQGLTSAGSVANTQQANQQSGLTSAGNLAQPSATAQGQTTYDPLTNSFSGGSYGTNLQTVVQAIENGNMGYTDGVNSLSSLSPTAKADVLAALGQGFDTVASDANAATRANIIGTQGSQVAGYQSALQQGQNLQSQLTDLITSFGLNPNDVNAVNTGLQKIAANISSPQYKILQNYVNDIANTYAQVLTPPGGSATDTTRGIATSMLDATAKGTSLIATMKALDEAAQAKIAGVSTTGASQKAITSSSNASALNSNSAWPGF